MSSSQLTDWFTILAGYVALQGLFLFSVSTFKGDDYLRFATPLVSSSAGVLGGGVLWAFLNGDSAQIAAGALVGGLVGYLFGRLELAGTKRLQREEGDDSRERVILTVIITIVSITVVVAIVILLFTALAPKARIVPDLVFLATTIIFLTVSIIATRYLGYKSLLTLGFVFSLLTIILAVAPAIIGLL